MLDTNVLLAATDEGRAEHRDALTILNEWAAGGATLCTSGSMPSFHAAFRAAYGTTPSAFGAAHGRSALFV